MLQPPSTLEQPPAQNKHEQFWALWNEARELQRRIDALDQRRSEIMHALDTL